MNENQALELIIKGLNVANQKGVFDLNTAAAMVQALGVISVAITPKKESGIDSAAGTTLTKKK